ncbi:MAG TPA: radical SAM protein [Longimicrobiaceae bacterium]|nr:radical SAM protein [Longimicrobiaceae bacterium]
MLLGFAVTEHCNLRCPHCIRDDVTTVRNLDADLLLSTVDQAQVLFDGDVAVTMTGGEPTLHPEWERIIAGLHRRGVPYRFVTNGWHMRRLIPSLERHPPAYVRVSLSGGDEAVHDAERGRGSFRRVLLAVALLTSRQIPATLGFVVDRRDRHQLRQAADLAESLGCVSIHFTLAQPVGASAGRDSDLSPAEWYAARDEILALWREGGRKTAVFLDYGAPAIGEEPLCDTFGLKRVYVDARGRLSLCCQLSEYGFNEADVVADLNRISFLEAWPAYVARLDQHRQDSRPRGDGDPFDPFPCIRCARSLGKMQWIRKYPQSPWHGAAEPYVPEAPGRLVALSYRGRSAQPA